MTFKNFSFYLFAVACLFSCNNKKMPKEETAKTDKFTLLDKKIIIPQNSEAYLMKNEVADSVKESLWASDYKILLYLDSAACTDCSMKYKDWENIMYETNITFPDKVTFLFFVHPVSKNKVLASLILNNFNNPVFVNEINEIDRLNNISQQFSFQCFLLDKNNRVLLVGNPFIDDNVWEKYKTAINGNVPVKKTTVKANLSTIDFGQIKSDSLYDATFYIENTGEEDLIIAKILTSCTCTVADWEKRKIAPKDTTAIKVDYAAHGNGMFQQKIKVYGNFEKSPLELKIQGKVSE